MENFPVLLLHKTKWGVEPRSQEAHYQKAQPIAVEQPQATATATRFFSRVSRVMLQLRICD